MTAKTLMIQGSMSSVGKSWLVVALCRIFARQGIKVAPFKAQNMSNNAAVTATGGEIGRAQYTQAIASGIIPTVRMNPVLIKPEADMRSQVIVHGKVWQNLSAWDYYQRKAYLWDQVKIAIDDLRESYDLIIIEGAGSPAELNLKRGDIVNMAVAKYLQSPVLLAGDIDRGGIFAQLLGTQMLFDPDEKALLKGFIVNRFRGDPKLFEDGITILEERGQVPVLGVIPYLHQHGIPEEDAVIVEAQTGHSSHEATDIAVLAFPRIANFDDFEPLAQEHGVQVRYVKSVDQLGNPSAIILPGTKSTIADFQWLQSQGFVDHLNQFVKDGGTVVGICGGYQMLGRSVHDPHHVESDIDHLETLGLLPTETTFASEKSTHQMQAVITGQASWLRPLNDTEVTGYEIHMGQTTSISPWLTIKRHNDSSHSISDGTMSANGRVWGCYIHGLFDNTEFRRAWLQSLDWQPHNSNTISLDSAINHVADVVEAHLNMDTLHQIIGL